MPLNHVREMLELITGNNHVTIVNDPSHAVGSADNINSYDSEYHLDDSRAEYAVTSRHAVFVTCGNKIVAKCILLAGGGASGIHEHSAIVREDSCIVACGPFMASLTIPTLKLNWATQTDDATCFGVYESREHSCLFSHGELLIARVSYDGTIVWNAGGADIFTNGFRIRGNVIHAIDFYDREYLIDIETGREIEA